MDDSCAKGPIPSHPSLSCCDGGLGGLGGGGVHKTDSRNRGARKGRITENKMTSREQYGTEDVERRSRREGTREEGSNSSRPDPACPCDLYNRVSSPCCPLQPRELLLKPSSQTQQQPGFIINVARRWPPRGGTPLWQSVPAAPGVFSGYPGVLPTFIG